MTTPDDVLGYHPDCGHELDAGLAVEFVVDDEGGVESACDTDVAVVETDVDDAERLSCAAEDCEHATATVREELRRKTLRHCGVVGAVRRPSLHSGTSLSARRRSKSGTWRALRAVASRTGPKVPLGAGAQRRRPCEWRLERRARDERTQ